MYIDMKAIRRSYPDILCGYHEQRFFPPGKTSGTVFRFPLRKDQSEISKNVMSKENMDAMFGSFKLELIEMMLFLKSVTKITVSTVDSDGFKTERLVSVSLADKDRAKQEKFSKRLKALSR